MNVRPIVVFLLTLLAVAPIVAIAGVAAWGNWAPTGLMVAGALLVWSGRRALVPIRESVPRFVGIQLRMKAVVWMVVVAAGLVSAAGAFWLGWRIVA